MGSILTRRRKDGSLGYTAIIRLKRDGQTVVSESATFGRRLLANEWMRQRESELDQQRARGEPLGKGSTVAAIGGRREVLVGYIGERADEVDDRALLDIPTAAHEVFVSKGEWTGRLLEEIAALDEVRAVFLRRIMRRGQEIPIGTRTSLERGDVVLLTGPEAAVLRAAEHLGERVQPTDATDFVAVGTAVFAGALFGAVVAVPVGSVTVTIGTSVGTLLAGIVTGHLRAHRPLFGRVPDSAVKFMQSFGLAGFVAIVGLGAGPHFVPAVRESGLGLLFGAMVVTMVPLMAGLWFGRAVLKIHPILLLGAISGAQTFTAGLAALQEKSDSAIAVFGYSGSVAIGDVFLTTWGTVIVLVGLAARPACAGCAQRPVASRVRSARDSAASGCSGSAQRRKLSASDRRTAA